MTFKDFTESLQEAPRAKVKKLTQYKSKLSDAANMEKIINAICLHLSHAELNLFIEDLK